MFGQITGERLVLDRRGLLGGVVAAIWAGEAEARTFRPKRWRWFGRHAANPAKAAATADPIVTTTAGKLGGAMQGRVAVFKGVPYGASTGGANRFRPPQPVAPWTGVREAKAFGLLSPQPMFPIIPEELGSMAQGPQGDDCLVLNVWTPTLDTAEKRPVMVWFHGGGYAVGGGSAPWYDGQNLADRHGVVVVTVNHRLNVFGFLYLDELAGADFAGSGNAGMLDCVAALKWVHGEIARFGGDPGNVTIFGESGGAGKVSTLMAMPDAKGLFHRAIAESGAALRHNTPAQASKSAKALLDHLGIAPGETARLQALTPEAILAGVASLKPPANFGPVVDGHAVPAHPFDPSAPALSADVPFMTGSNLTEVTFFLDTPLEPLDDAGLHEHVKSYTKTDAATADRLVSLYRVNHPTRENTVLYQIIASDYWMRSVVLAQAERRAWQGGAPVYVYQFNWMSPGRGGKLNCPHGSEIPFAYDNVDKATVLVGEGASQQALADRMSAAWVSFARSGRPEAPHLPHWPAYSEGRAVMVFDNECRVELDPGSEGRVAIAELKAVQAV